MCNYIVQHLASGDCKAAMIHDLKCFLLPMLLHHKDYKTCMYLLRESFAGRYGML